MNQKICKKGNKIILKNLKNVKKISKILITFKNLNYLKKLKKKNQKNLQNLKTLKAWKTWNTWKIFEFWILKKLDRIRTDDGIDGLSVDDANDSDGRPAFQLLRLSDEHVRPLPQTFRPVQSAPQRLLPHDRGQTLRLRRKRTSQRFNSFSSLFQFSFLVISIGF